MSKDVKHPNVPTPHITANYGDFAETVLMPGDPLRAKFIADNFLYNFYGVKSIIRIGSCGSFDKDLHVRDIIIAQGACTNGNYAMQYNLPGTFCPIADFSLIRRAAELCEQAGVNYKVGNIFSSDMFYDDANSGMQWAKMGVLGVEMESAALYCNAARAGKKALCICTVSDSFLHPEENTTAEERQNSFTAMMKIALELA